MASSIASFSLSSTVAHYPAFAYKAVKDAILGPTYCLSLTFIGTKRAAAYNKQYRQKDYVPNVLSFPLTETTGEIFICPKKSYPEAVAHNLSPKGYIVYLFIHGLLHLKGHDHSDDMDTLEQQYLRKFKVV